MAHPNKTKGDAYERAVRDHCQAAGFDADRTRAGYARDHGDIHLATSPVGPRVIVQAKNHARLCLSEWLQQLDEQVGESGARHGFLAVKRRGVGDPGKSYAVMELDALLVLLRQAGYGSPIPEEKSA
jgi:hypothetical protein